MTTAHKLQNTTILFLCLAPVIVIWYGLFIFNPTHIDNLPLYIIQIVADIIAIIVMLSLWVTILYDVIIPTHHHSNTPKANLEMLNQGFTVDILIPTAGEPIEVIKTTVKHALQVQYPHSTYLLDDANSESNRQLAITHNIGYITRDNRKHAKAGNLNNAFQYVKGEFFIILDADQIAKPNLITALLPFMFDQQVAMVQSPQTFTNTHEFIAKGSAQSQEIFYKHICPAKNVSNSVFCVGTNMLYRRSAIDQIGGIAKVSHSEDIWTTLLLHEKKWKTIFVNRVLAQGTAPGTINSFYRQQLRWAKGGFSMLLHRNPLYNNKLTLDQKIQYATSNSFYLVGIVILVYLLMPILYLLFEIKPFQTESGAEWLLHYLPFVLLYFSLTLLLVRKLHIATIAIAAASFYPYILALIQILIGEKKSIWITTSSKKSHQDSLLKWIWPHISIICISIFALIFAWYEPLNLWTTMYNSFWVLWNVYLLSLFIFFNDRKINV